MAFSKTEWRIICVSFVVLMFVSAAAAANIKTIETKPTDIVPNTKFTVKVNLGGITCGMQMKFYLDDAVIDEKNVGCNTDNVESDDIDLVKDPVACGTHTLKVELIDSGSVVQTKTMSLDIGNVPAIAFSPKEPRPQGEITITFTDAKTGKGLDDLDVEIYNLKTGSSSMKEYSADNQGKLTFTSDSVGEFRMTITDPDYCGTLDFRVLRPLPYQGPIPESPVVGERIGVAVPSGVGVKYIDSSGKVFPLMNLGGGANFTIDKPGQYRLVMADISTVFWKVEKNFTVSSRPIIAAKTEPAKPVVNKVVVLSFTARGSPLNSTAVKITKPIGGSETLETGLNGDVRFTPETIGTYHFRIEKERFEVLDGTFEAFNGFDVAIGPYEPVDNQDITINVTDQLGARVENAMVYVEDNTGVLVSETTGYEGSFKFRLAEPKEYTIKVQKDSYWDFEKKITVYGLLTLTLSPARMELGNSTRISTTDKDDKEITADITVTRPDGRSDSVKNRSYLPAEVGVYTVKATKSGYRTGLMDLTVEPHPLNLSVKISGRDVIAELTSHGEPVSGLTVVIKTPTEEKQVVSDEDGVASAKVDREGNLSISANEVSKNEDYESRSMKSRILKEYSYPMLLIPMFFVVVSALIVVGVIEYFHRYKQKAKKEGGLFYKGGFGPKKGTLQKGKSSLSEQ